MINVIVDHNDPGGALSSHADVAKVAFTGSTATGKKVMCSVAGTLKRLILELGGNDAAIVLDDVDPIEVAPKLLVAATMNAGQICLGAKRRYVHDSQYDQICEELGRLARASVVGDGLKQGTQIGPLQNKAKFESVTRGISVPNAAPSTQGLPSVDPIYTWIRLAQRVPVRVRITDVQPGIPLVSGMTVTVTIRDAGTRESGGSLHRRFANAANLVAKVVHGSKGSPDCFSRVGDETGTIATPVSKSRPKFSFDIGNSAPSSGDSGQMHFTVTEVCGRRRRPCPSNGVNRKSLFYWLRAYPNWSTRPSMEPNYPRDHYSWQMGAAVHHWSLPRKFMGGGAPFSRRTP